jgi:hypothetical protein
VQTGQCENGIQKFLVSFSLCDTTGSLLLTIKIWKVQKYLGSNKTKNLNLLIAQSLVVKI